MLQKLLKDPEFVRMLRLIRSIFLISVAYTTSILFSVLCIVAINIGQLGPAVVFGVIAGYAIGQAFANFLRHSWRKHE